MHFTAALIAFYASIVSAVATPSGATAVAQSSVPVFAQFLRYDHNKILVSGTQGDCFGINATNDGRLAEILKISANTGVFFYTGENCRRDTRINDGKPPQSEIGMTDKNVANMM